MHPGTEGEGVIHVCHQDQGLIKTELQAYLFCYGNAAAACFHCTFIVISQRITHLVVTGRNRPSHHEHYGHKEGVSFVHGHLDELSGNALNPLGGFYAELARKLSGRAIHKAQ
ncbi:hypothetical protein FQZ97_1233240 [compost metagenome]